MTTKLIRDNQLYTVVSAGCATGLGIIVDDKPVAGIHS